MFKDFLNNSLERISMKSQASYVEVGYGQVEPNHLSAQRTGQIYAQLPAAPAIKMLEQGQFVKYDYAANDNGIGEVNFTGAGEWMMVYNEIKLYRNHPDGSKQWDCEFAMIKDDFQARVYSPYDYEMPEEEYHNGLYLNGKDSDGKTSMSVTRHFTAEHPVRDAQGKTIFKSIMVADKRYDIVPKHYDAVEANAEQHILAADARDAFIFVYNGKDVEIDPVTGETKTSITVEYAYDDVTKDVEDIYELGFTNDPWTKLGIHREKKMPAGTAMVPRVIKTNVGDLFTTNTINEETTLAVGDILTPQAADGILAKKDASTAAMKWQVVKVYTVPDGQKGVKVMRIA